MQTLSSVNISDRVEGQLPDFIKQEDEQFVNFLFEYYKSQEKTGRPYDLLNNILDYLDIDAYDQKVLASSTTLIKDVDTTNSLIEVESIDGFMDRDGSVMIDNEVIYYESVTRGPDVIITPGISYPQFNKKKQQLENPFTLFDGTETIFGLSFLGTPVAPPSAEHLIVIAYNTMMVPNVDYFVEGLNLRFNEAPRDQIGSDDSEFTSITYLVGYSDQTIKTCDSIPYQEWQNTKYYPLRINTQSYTPTSEIGLIINKNGRLQVPYEDFTVFEDKVVFKNEIGAADAIHIRSVEYTPPSYGSGATAIAKVDVDTAAHAADTEQKLAKWPGDTGV